MSELTKLSDNPYMAGIQRKIDDANAYNEAQAKRRASAAALKAARDARRESAAVSKRAGVERHNLRLAMWARHKLEVAELKARHAAELALL